MFALDVQTFWNPAGTIRNISCSLVIYTFSPFLSLVHVYVEFLIFLVTKVSADTTFYVFTFLKLKESV